MSRRTDQELLNDVRQALARIAAYIAGMDYAAFSADTKTQDAVVRNLEVLGEAAKRLSDQERAVWPALPWNNMARARDRLIHHYFGVNLDIVWQIATDELPPVAAALQPGPEPDT